MKDLLFRILNQDDRTFCRCTRENGMRKVITYFTGFLEPGSSAQPNPGTTDWINRFSLAVVLLLHLGAVCIFFPPWEALRTEPLYHVDYPVHTHRVYVYREALLESGLPWGYDPALSAGSVMNPGSDMGAKPQQVLGLLLPFLKPGTIVRLFLFLVLLTFPLWTLLTCNRLGIKSDDRVCIMLTLLAPAWLLPQLNMYFSSGVIGFAAASYFSAYVLTLFISFLSNPRLSNYLGFVLATSFLFLLHILGPLVLVPPLLFYGLTWRSITWKWRIAVCLTPVVILTLNGFWLVPFLLHWDMPSPAWTRLPALSNPDTHLTYNNWGDFHDKLSQPLWLGPQILGLGLGIYGCVLLRKIVGPSVSISVALVVFFALFLAHFGSFIPGVVAFQPIRFALPAFVFLTIPVGLALAALLRKVQIPVGFSMAGLAVFSAFAALWTGELKSLPLPPLPDYFAQFVARETTPMDRLLVQSSDGYRVGGYETKIFPLHLRREVIGCTFQQVHDPAQFLDRALLGRELKDWTKEELQSALQRWGVTWVFTANSEGHALMSNALGNPVAEVGDYRAFRVNMSTTRFLIGDGVIETKVNRLDLKRLRPKNGLVVIRYRYHPAWEAIPEVQIVSYSIPEDPSGFIAIKDPPESVTLRFDPMAMLHAQWPERQMLSLTRPDTGAQNISARKQDTALAN